MTETYIRIYDNMLPVEICRSIVEEFEQAPQQKSKMVSGIREDIRKSTFVDMTKLAGRSTEWQVLDDAVSDIVTHAWNMYANDLKLYSYVSPIIRDQGYEVHRYEPDGHYGLHCDSGSEAIGHRFLSILIYLNDDDYGETHFPGYQLNIRCVEGRVVVFPSGFTHIHEGKRPKNIKYIITAFMSH